MILLMFLELLHGNQSYHDPGASEAFLKNKAKIGQYQTWYVRWAISDEIRYWETIVVNTTILLK